MTPVYWIDNEWEEVKTLLNTGLTVRQVAKKVGREPRSIWSKMRTERLSPEERKRGYDLRNQPFSPLWKFDFCCLYGDCMF